MAEAVVGSAVVKIGNLLIEEGKYLHGVSDQVEELQRELELMVSFLREADSRQNDDQRIKSLISHTRDLAYEAADLIESYALKGKRNLPKRHSIGSKIQKLRSKISALNKSFQDYGVSAVPLREASTSTDLRLRRTYSHVVEDDFIRIDGDVEMLADKLVNHHEVVSIYGMGGLGKTTLARKVYSHPSMKQYFESFVWICITQQWQQKDILQGILTKLMPEKKEEIQGWRNEELVRQLREFLQQRKSLVVLDDIWSADAWDLIKDAMPIRNDGSKILLTTRNRDVAVQISPGGYRHKPRLLSEDESWELLQKKAFRGKYGEDRECTKEMKDLGMKMLKHCQGLPLAVVVLGGVLASKSSLTEWESVDKHVKTYLEKGRNVEQQRGGVSQVLGLSYDDLPYKLKPCFLYLSKYPEDDEIDVETLYQLWIAEGLISMEDKLSGESMMEVAEHYLRLLVERCMVQVENKEMPSLTKFRSCRLHDLMRDLSLEKAKEENFFLSINYRAEGFDNGVQNNSSSNRHIHRLSISLSKNDVSTYVAPTKEITKHLRSFTFCVRDWYPGTRMPRTLYAQLNWLKMLRVLAIEGIKLGVIGPESFKEWICRVRDNFKLAKAFGDLIHLRCLSLRRSSSLFFALFLGNLKHLQTLDLRIMDDRFWIPNVLFKMRHLRHLYLPERSGSRVNGFFKLRLDALSKLEVLVNFDPSFCSAEGLSKLTSLRSLRARVGVCYEDVSKLIEMISTSRSLRVTSLEVRSLGWEESRDKEKCSVVLRKLFSCCNLHDLFINGSLASLPDYERGFLNSGLVSLVLIFCQLIEDPMETLGRLPNLRCLEVAFGAYVGKELLCGAACFPKLRELQLRFLHDLQKWTIVEGAMPNLESLTLHGCDSLEMIPDGLRFITTLKELTVYEMPEQFVSRLRLVEGREGEDFDKVKHVHSITIRLTLDTESEDED